MLAKNIACALLLSAGALLCLASGCDRPQSTPAPSPATSAIESKSLAPVIFRVPNTPITIWFPRHPTVDRHTVPLKTGDLDITIYSASDELTDYSVAVNLYPEGVVNSIAPDGERFLYHMADAAIQARPGSKVMARRRVSIGDWPGLEEQVEMPSGRTGNLHSEMPVIVTRQYYQDGDRMYLFQVLILKSIYDVSAEKFSRDATAFFNSLETVPNNGAK